MLSRISEPAKCKANRRSSANQDPHDQQNRDCKQQLKEEVPKPLFATLAPIPSNMTYLIDDAVEQDEPHHAADVEEHKKQNDPDDHEQGDTDPPQHSICGHSLSEELISPIRSSRSPW